MKTIFGISMLCLMLNAGAQNDQSWHFGLQWGFHGNSSTFSGGMEGADARFEHQEFGGGTFGLQARYDIDRHWMFTTGMGINTYGFEYTLNNNYSLINELNRESVVRTEFSCLEMPNMIHYKFNPSCNNSKWVIGAGFVQSFIGAGTMQGSYTASNEGSMNAEHLNCQSQSYASLNYTFRMCFAREKVFKRGSILSAAFVFNIGFKEIASSHVEYEIGTQSYHHDFSNKGSYFGFKFDYYLRDFKTK